MWRYVFKSFISLAALSASCTRTEIVNKPLVSAVPLVGNQFTISDVDGITVQFNRVRVTLVGLDWQVIGAIEVPFSGGQATMGLPTNLSPVNLCKGARDTWDDWEGFWPAEGVSDRDARMAAFANGNIVAYNGSTPVGRLYLTNVDSEDLSEVDPTAHRWFIYYVYSDRPVTLSGFNLVRPGVDRRSFRYDASFAAGWNAYANVHFLPEEAGGDPAPSLCTTNIPGDVFLRWRFEPWIGEEEANSTSYRLPETY